MADILLISLHYDSVYYILFSIVCSFAEQFDLVKGEVFLLVDNSMNKVNEKIAVQ